MTLMPSIKKTPFTVSQSIPDHIVLDSYPGPLEQVLINLVQNAVDATAHHPAPRVSVRLTEADGWAIDRCDDRHFQRDQGIADHLHAGAVIIALFIGCAREHAFLVAHVVFLPRLRTGAKGSEKKQQRKKETRAVHGNFKQRRTCRSRRSWSRSDW